MSALVNFWKKEEAAAAKSGDLSHIKGRYWEDPLPWSYPKWLREFLKPNTRLLDLGTGDGTFLLGLSHPPALTTVTEGREASFALCQRRLAPLGITVALSQDTTCLPFPGESFDLVISRHASYCIEEVRRVLKKGGHFVTQQVGARNNQQLSQRLGLCPATVDPRFNLENEALSILKAGFRIPRRAQCYPQGYFTDLGALCHFAKHFPGEFPDFSVARCEKELLSLQREIEKTGVLHTQAHRFILVAKKQ